MLIGFIKHNRAISVFFLPVAILIIWAFGFIHPSTPPTEYATSFYKALISRLGNYPVLLPLFSCILIFIESLLINYIVKKNEIIDTTAYLPALIYIILMSLQPEMLSLHPIVIANLFMLLALIRLMNTYKKETAYSEVFDTGMFIALAAIFYTPSFVFIFVLWAGLVIIRPFIWREWIISLFGFATPLLFFVFYYFWNGILDTLVSQVIQNTVIAPHKSFQWVSFSIDEYIQICILLLAGFFSFGKLLDDLGKSTVRIRNNLLLLFYFILLSLVSIIFAPGYSISYLSFLSIPFSIFISNYFLFARKTWIAEVLFLLLVLSIFINQFIQ